MKKLIILAVLFICSFAVYGDEKSDNVMVDLIEAAKERTLHDVKYDGSYFSIPYPNDEDELAKLLGVIYETKFIHTKEESDEWLAKWKANPDIQTPWDYGSWVDAILNSETELGSLQIETNGSGKLTFNQFAWPTGGIGALEELINIFGGKVISNDAI